MEEIKISIIVPIYNIKEYIQKCIESIIGQSYKNIEIILVDDGSTDGCAEKCDYYAVIDNRIKVIHKKNGGLVSARKAGTAIATGDYILNVDGDDWIEKNRIKVLVNKGIVPFKSDMVYLSGYKRDFLENSTIVDSDIPIKTFYGEEIREEIFPLLKDVNEAFKTNIITTLWMWAIKRELLQEKQELVDNRITMAEDAICTCFCLLSAQSVTLIRENGYHYIQRKSSLSYMAAFDPKDNYLGMRIWYHQMRDYLEENHVSEKIKKIFIFMTIFQTMIADYRLLLRKNPKCLYPFSQVRKGHKIVVYGAGRIGYSLMTFLLESKDYQVMLWVDQNKKRYAIPGYSINSIKDIINVDYDYVVIAIQNVNVVKEVKYSLIQEGIMESKIAVMDAKMITEESIPEEIKC